jgi:MFS family permease
MGGGIGTIILAPVVTFLMNYYGFQGGFLLIGGLALNCFVAAALLRPKVQPIKTKEVKELEIDVIVKTDEKPETKLTDEVDQDINPLDKEKNETPDEKKSIKKSSPKSRVKGCFKSCSFQLLLNRTFLFYCSCLATLPFCIQVLLLFIADFAKENSIGQRERAILISVMGAADIVGRLVAGVLLDLKSVQHKRTHVQLGTGMLLGALTMCVALGQNVPLLYTICILQGIVEGMFHSQRATILSDFVPKEQQPLATGWIIFFQGIGNFCGPIIGG